MMKRILPALVLLTGCANDPIVDMYGVDPERFEVDLAECKQYAAQVSTAKESVEGGAIGAAVGAVIGAAIGDHNTAERVAGVGGTSGALKGGTRAEERKERVLYNCLRGRGYKVLG